MPVAVAIFSMALPVVLALVALPTAMSDTRELIAWGRAWPLVTPKHPPMMTWVGALVDLALGQSAAASILVNQVLVGIGVLYLFATLKLIIEKRAAGLMTFLFATSIYVVGAPLSYALNADILQITSWSAVIYHFLAAVRSNRIGHWLALGAWAAAAILTKYNAGVLFLGMLVAGLLTREFRAILLNPRLWIAALVASVLVAPHALALRSHPEALHFAGDQLRNPLGMMTLDSLGGLLFGFVFFLAPGWLFVAIGVFRREASLDYRAIRAQVSWPEALKFLLITNIAILCILVVLIFLGLHYLYRFDAPYLAVAALAISPLIAWNDDHFNAVSRRIVLSAAIVNSALFVGAVLAYLLIVSHDRMQEPVADAAAAIMADWNSRYTCGPGYFLGEAPSVYGVGNAASPDAIALLTDMVPRARWFDRDKLDGSGAVVLYRGRVPVGALQTVVPKARLTAETTLRLPLLRTITGRTISYHYRFIPPQRCTAGVR